MKKLMIGLFACVLTGAVKAAPTVTVDFGTGYSGWTVWAVNYWNNGRAALYPTVNAPSKGYTTGYDYASLLDNASSAADQLTYLNAAKNTDYVGTWLRYYKNGTFSTVDASGISSAADNGGMYSWLFVLVESVDKDGKAIEGTRYAVIESPEQASVVTYEDGDYSKATYGDISNGYSVANDTLRVTGGYNAIPEPTSGLLLLLGVAGLALRRKRA